MNGSDEFLEHFRNKIGKKKSDEYLPNPKEEDQANVKEQNQVEAKTKEDINKQQNNQDDNKEEGPRVSHFLQKNIYSNKFFGNPSQSNESGVPQSKSVSQQPAPENEKKKETIADIVSNPDNFFTYESNDQNKDHQTDKYDISKKWGKNNQTPEDDDDDLNLEEETNPAQGRTSTNKLKILSHLKKKLKEEEQASGNIDIRPRLSVRDMIQSNENRLQQINNEKIEEQRRSNMRLKNKEIWQNRMKEISEFIRLEKEEGETQEEFYESNNEFLKDFGITNYKDFLSVQELIQFYEKGLISGENLTAKGQRNTTGTNKNKVIGLNISEIEEEKEDDNAMSKNSFANRLNQFEKKNNAPVDKTKVASKNEIDSKKKINQFEKAIDVDINKTKAPSIIEIDSGQRMTYTSKPKSFNLITQIAKGNSNISYSGKKKNLQLSINSTQNIKLSAKAKEPLIKQTSSLNYNSLPKKKHYKNENLSVYSNINTTIAFPQKKLKQNPNQFNSFDHNFSYSYLNKPKTSQSGKIAKEWNIYLKPSKKPKSKFAVSSQETSETILIKQKTGKKRYQELFQAKKEVNLMFRSSYVKELKIMMECYDEVVPKKVRPVLYVQNIMKLFYNGRKKDINYRMESYQGDAGVFGKKKPISIASKIINIGYFSKTPSPNSIVNLPSTSLIGVSGNNQGKFKEKPYDERHYAAESRSNDDEPRRVKATKNKQNYYELNEDEEIELQIKPNNEFMKDARPTLDKILTSNLRNTQYQRNIISSLDSINVMKYSLNSNIPFDPSFLDVLCISCYECIKLEEMDFHSSHCVIRLESYQDNSYDEDYNSRIFKLHESLKDKKNEIIKTKNLKLISFYNKLLQVIYDILINNNSIEELDKSISTITEMINSELHSIDESYNFYFLMFSQRLSQLVYMKLKDMEKILVMIQNNDDDSDEDYGQEEEMDPEEIKYVKMQLSSLENKQQQAQQELKQWRKEAKKLDNNLRRPMRNNNEILSDIVSDINSRAESIDVMTTFTGQGSEMNDYFEMDHENNPDEFTEEDQKKYFLALGLGVKFKYSDKIKDSVSIAELFDKAKSQNVPIGEYQHFIIKELLPSGISNINRPPN